MEHSIDLDWLWFWWKQLPGHTLGERGTVSDGVCFVHFSPQNPVLCPLYSSHPLCSPLVPEELFSAPSHLMLLPVSCRIQHSLFCPCALPIAWVRSIVRTEDVPDAPAVPAQQGLSCFFKKGVSPYTTKHSRFGPPGKHRLKHPTPYSTSSITLQSGPCSKSLYRKADTEPWVVLGNRIPSFIESQWCMTGVYC